MLVGVAVCTARQFAGVRSQAFGAIAPDDLTFGEGVSAFEFRSAMPPARTAG